MTSTNSISDYSPVEYAYYLFPLFSFLVFAVHHLLGKTNNLYFVIMSEQEIQDENSVATEQNSMVQRIALEVKRREPGSVSVIFSI